jgi:hypothetical protein
MIKSRKMRLAALVARLRAMRSAYKILVGKPGSKRLLGSPRHRWENNIRMNVGNRGLEGVDWIRLAQKGDR